VNKECCLTCEHFDDCPIIKLWAELNAPIVAVSFCCSEYRKVNIEGHETQANKR